MYITTEELIKKSSAKRLFIFGTGIDAEDLLNRIKEKEMVCAFVDNRRAGYSFFGFDVIDRDELYKRIDKRSVLVIASYCFAHEILAELDQDILVAGDNCFIWDDSYIFHEDRNIREYIQLNQTLWGPQRRENKRKKILIPFENRHLSRVIMYAYFANREAELYDAEIIGFPSRGDASRNASPVMKRIYASFNTVAFLDGKLSESQKKTVDHIMSDLWRNIYRWDDWKEIEVLGIRIGTTIIRYMLRFFIPSLEARSETNRDILKECIEIIVFWSDYFIENDVEMVFLSDGVCWEGFLRDVAVSKGVPTYALQGEIFFKKATLNFHVEPSYPYFKNFWEMLSEDEKKYGLKWAEQRLEERLGGSTEDIPYMEGKSVYEKEKRIERQLKESDRIKVLICPHVFVEDCYVCGEQIFDNNYISWLCHLGELSNRTEYDWYLKMHPNSEFRDEIIIGNFLKKYPRIKKISTTVSPWQLKEEGLDVVLTVYGTVAHEYPAMGIPAITAGINPHIAFDFAVNPKDKQEYDEILMNLDVLDRSISKEEIYKFYAIYYLYYDWKYNFFSRFFFENPAMYMDRYELRRIGKDHGTWIYGEYISNWKKERHESLYAQVDGMIERMNRWEASTFYKKEILL